MTTSLRPGDRLQTREQFIELPRGSVIRLAENHADWYRKRSGSGEEAHWLDGRSGSALITDLSFFAMDGSNEVVHVGTDLTVGSQVRGVAQLDDLSVGSSIGYDRVSPRFRKVASGRWRMLGEGDNDYPAADIGGNAYVVVEVPDADGNGDLIISNSEGIERFTFRLHNYLKMKVESTGVNGARRALEALALTPPVVPPWNGMENTVASERLDWPEGVVFRTGTPGGSDCDVFVKTGPGRQARNLLRNAGYGPFDSMKVTIVSGAAGDPPEWWDRPQTAEDRAAIRELTLRTWAVGMRYKRSNGWCGEFERALEAFGLPQPTEAEIRDAEEGTRAARTGRTAGSNLDSSQTRPTISTAQARALPVGTLLERSRPLSDGTRSVYVRVAEPFTNPARTRRLVNDTRLGHYAAVMVVVAQPGQTLAEPWPIPSEEVLNALPVGSVVSTDRASRRYSKREDGGYWCTCCPNSNVERFTWRGTAYLRELSTVPAVPVEPAGEQAAVVEGNRYLDTEVAAMPEGTLVRWHRPNDNQDVYMVRCADGVGEARTRQVILDGQEFMGDHSTRDIELVALAENGDLNWRAGDDLLRLLPVRTVIRHNASGNRYTREEGVWRRESDGARFGTRTGSQWRVVSVPPRTQVAAPAAELF